MSKYPHSLHFSYDLSCGINQILTYRKKIPQSFPKFLTFLFLYVVIAKIPQTLLQFAVTVLL